MTTSKHCVPCEGTIDKLSHQETTEKIEHLNTWTLDENVALEKELKFDDFAKALVFVNKVGELAEKEGHHPDISIFNYNHVKLRLSTHAIAGLSDNDFILAELIDGLLRETQ